MAPKCGVCHQADSKYRCPRSTCQVRYCSLACYKTHKPIHDNEPENEPSEIPSTIRKDRPGTTQRIPKVDFTGFEKDKQFKHLLTRYPMLQTQLQTLYGLTLEPGPDEARTWHRRPLPSFTPAQVPPQRGSRGRERRRGRGDRGRGGSRGGWTAGEAEEREHGVWTQEKGDREALRVMKKLRGEGRDGDRDDFSEGMREFVELCRIKFGDGREET